MLLTAVVLQAIAKLAECGVKLIAMRCAGYDRVDLEACEQHGIKVVRVPTYSPTSVAEHAVGLLFALNRCVHILEWVKGGGGGSASLVAHTGHVCQTQADRQPANPHSDACVRHYAPVYKYSGSRGHPRTEDEYWPGTVPALTLLPALPALSALPALPVSECTASE
jgi:lactate dehydrogenase-like 2-hydroxyacid dehydrogenase